MSDDHKVALLTVEVIEARLEECKRLLKQIDAIIRRSQRETTRFNMLITHSHDLRRLVRFIAITPAKTYQAHGRIRGKPERAREKPETPEDQGG